MKKHSLLRWIFDIGIIIKGIDGFIESIGGISLLFIKPSQLISIVHFFTRAELSHDPSDLIANFIVQIAENLSIKTEIFAALYILAHGLVKIFLVINLLRDRLWAYPVSLTVIGLFLAFQLYHLLFHFSLILAAFSTLDIVVIILIWQEYRVRLRDHR